MWFLLQSAAFRVSGLVPKLSKATGTGLPQHSLLFRLLYNPIGLESGHFAGYTVTADNWQGLLSLADKLDAPLIREAS